MNRLNKYIFTLSAVATANFFPFGDQAIADTFCIPSTGGIKLAEYRSCILNYFEIKNDNIKK